MKKYKITINSSTDDGIEEDDKTIYLIEADSRDTATSIARERFKIKNPDLNLRDYSFISSYETHET